nr:hypothetical protein [Mesorhizobium sp. STM 4661]
MHRAGGVRFRFDHACQRADFLGDRARAALVTYAGDIPGDMSEPGRDPRAGRLGDLADSLERDNLLIEVNAKLGRLIPVCRHDMDLLDPVSHFKIGSQPRDTCVGLVRDLRQQQREVQA